jgi:hypothetical protein
VQAHILVLDHDALRLHKRFGDIEILCCVIGGGAQGPAQGCFIGVINEIDAVSRADVSAPVALNAFCAVEDSLHIAIQTSFSLAVGRVDIEA